MKTRTGRIKLLVGLLVHAGALAILIDLALAQGPR